jgi:H+-transporting ATPase
MNSIAKKIAQILFLGAGLLMTGQAILTPMLMVILMVTGDFLSMSLTTDNVRPSPLPNVWKIGRLTMAAVIIGVFNLLFCIGIYAFGKFYHSLELDALRTLALVSLVFSGEASLYVIREHRHIWSSCPNLWVIVSSVADVFIVFALASQGIAMSALPLFIVGQTLVAAVAFAFIMDFAKIYLFNRLEIA